jgi:hypothetical protein
MEGALAEIVAQNKDILKRLDSVISRIEDLESKVMRGEPKQFKQSPSSASADTHVMVEEYDESISHDRAPKPPGFSREAFGDSPLMARSMHQSSDHSFGILKDPNIKMVPPKVECKDPSKIQPKEFLEYFENSGGSGGSAGSAGFDRSCRGSCGGSRGRNCRRNGKNKANIGRM